MTAAATAAGNFVAAPRPFTPLGGGVTSIAPPVAAEYALLPDAHYINKVDGKRASRETMSNTKAWPGM